MSRLNEMILEFRENIGQSIEGLALLMQMEPEEYSQLEKDWIPPDAVLQKLCSLFEWNYKEIKNIANNSPSKKLKKNHQEEKLNPSLEINNAEEIVSPFAKMIREARISAKQDAKGIATLMGITVDYYKQIEDGFLPPNETIRKICTLFGWNFKQIRQKINAQSTAQFGNRQPLLDVKEIQSRLPKLELPEMTDFEKPISLHEQIHQARIDADQNVEGISLLLQINPEFYEKIESGLIHPDPELLKRISSLFGWNYHDLLIREKSSHYKQLIPTITKLDSENSSLTEKKLRQIQEEIAVKWDSIPEEHQDTLLRQMEFLLGSMKNLNQSD